MKIQLTIPRDMTQVAALGGRLKDKALLQALGMQLVSMAKRAFDEEALRASAWPARKSGGDHKLLKKSGDLWRSLRVTGATTTSVSVSSHLPYAAIHQLGGTTKPHIIRPKAGKKALAFMIGGKKVFAGAVRHPGSKVPARPFFPITPAGQLTPEASTALVAMLRKHLDAGK